MKKVKGYLKTTLASLCLAGVLVVFTPCLC